MSQQIKTDVLISGGGPVGLLVAYGLARQGVKALVVEQHDKDKQAMYGRATTLYPRTLEMLDQLDLLDDMNQRRTCHLSWMAYHVSTHNRHKYSEGVFRDAYKRLGGEPYIGWKLESLSVDPASEDDYKVTSHIRNLETNETVTVKSKYIVGADGGHSLVRRLAGITSEVEQTESKWIRIDGRLKTNMPDADLGFASIESKSHRNVLWVQLDHGVKRIGFAMTKQMMAKY
ncbi:hypothetical protein ASPCAL03697 [Aspergillus calidoustus]|uniref:FAD-binding domain-containing protein n=1 Tax=Aspergillus calidoustus TaxID=454130 RepID=A0A0U5FSP6_ASPCI|nr:hypothetical protein ASPCAL03697 [Aspergillus calidoustus]